MRGRCSDAWRNAGTVAWQYGSVVGCTTKKRKMTIGFRFRFGFGWLFHLLKRLNFLPTFSNALGRSEFEGGDMVIGRYWLYS